MNFHILWTLLSVLLGIKVCCSYSCTVYSLWISKMLFSSHFVVTCLCHPLISLLYSTLLFPVCIKAHCKNVSWPVGSCASNKTTNSQPTFLLWCVVIGSNKTGPNAEVKPQHFTWMAPRKTEKTKQENRRESEG